MRTKFRSLVLAFLIAAVSATPAHAAAGSVDPAFGVGGQAQAGLEGGATVLHGGLFKQSDGRIVVAGTFQPANPDPSQPGSGDSGDAVLARFTRSGKRDMDYGTDGWARDDRFETLGRPVAGAADTLLLPGGELGHNLDATAWVARFTADGDRDERFGDDGAVKLPLPAAGFWGTKYIAVDRDGSMYLSVFASPHQDADGNWVPNTMGYAIVHLLGNGKVDKGFGNDGLAETENTLNETAGPLVIAPDGGIVMAGSLKHAENGPIVYGMVPQTVLTRYDSKGRLDKSFGDGGHVVTPIDADAADLVVDRKGNLSVTGPSNGPPLPRSAVVARYDSTGAPVADFGDKGEFKLLVGTSLDPSAAALQGDGKLVVAGGFLQVTGNSTHSDQTGWTIFRVKPTGKLDKDFGDKGIITSARGPSFTAATDVEITDDGNVIAGGTANDCHGGGSMTLVRFIGEDDGKPDPGPLVSTCEGTLPLDDSQIQVTIACPLIEDECDGTVAVDQYVEAAKAKPAGKARFAMGGNHVKTARVKLSSAARKYARAHKKFKALVTITARDGDGHRGVFKRRVTVKG